MKRIKNLIAEITDLDNLYLAFWKASKGKRYAEEILAYQSALDKNLSLLRSHILRGGVDVGNYHYFKIYEPKERQICASAFREQVLHHALMNVCHPYFERTLIFDSYASRKGKGTYAAIDRAKAYSNQYSFFLKLDVKKFFDSIHHAVLKVQLSRMFKDYGVLSIFNQIIDSYEASPQRGLPIGNLTSQYFANHYLSSLDHFIKEELGAKAYVRYMDDMVLWHDDKAVLKSMYKAIKGFVENELQCNLKPELLNYTSCGLPFLGYVIRPHHVSLTQHSKQRFIRKMDKVEYHYDSGIWSEEKCQRRALPLLAFIEHADTEGFRRQYFYKEKGQISRV
jgi:RNA-directed DNA polymerase